MGEKKLVDFYRTVGRASERSGAVESALRKVLGMSLTEFTALWRKYVAIELG
ncbi:Lipoprotein OS=Streptomyces antimycoticus OX=68175 GN=SANT12839_030200 PE=4 SV=1 [Streptomyces antimycoticus]